MADDDSAAADGVMPQQSHTIKAPLIDSGKGDAEEISFISTDWKKAPKHVKVVNEDEPLIDTTAALILNSKKTKRLLKQQARKQQKAAKKPLKPSLLNLPTELFQEVASYLRPSDVCRLSQVNHGVHDFLQQNENAIARTIIRRRYWVLSRCFPLPVPFEEVSLSARPAILSEPRQNMVQVHRKPYQHIKSIEPLEICTCMSCLFAWNNLNVILDLAHWQKNLNERQPIPMIPRGTSPEWNTLLTTKHAQIVEKAMNSRLVYAAILEKHLRTTTQMVFRTLRSRKASQPKKFYHLTPTIAAQETDEFLEDEGPHSYEFPWHRDNYYNMHPYLPNRKWSKEKEKWIYYAEGLHEKDVAWVKEKFATAKPAQLLFEKMPEHWNNVQEDCVEQRVGKDG